MPVLEDPAGVQDERKFLVGQFVGRQVRAGDEAASAGRRGKTLAKENLNSVAGFRIGARPQLAGRAEVVMRKAVVACREAGKFGEDFRRRFVLHREAESAGDLADDLPVLPRLTR